LNLKCKRYKRKKKNRKEKEENKIKLEKGRGNPFGPIEKGTRGPATPLPNR
jgi:hypothetical protein